MQLNKDFSYFNTLLIIHKTYYLDLINLDLFIIDEEFLE